MFLQTKQTTSALNLKLPVPGRQDPQRILEKYPGSASPPAPQSPKPLNLAAQLPNRRKQAQELATQVWRELLSNAQCNSQLRTVSSQRETTLLRSAIPPSIHACIFLPSSLPSPLLLLLFLFPLSLHSPLPRPHPLLKKVSCSPNWLQTEYIVKDDAEFLILLPLAPKCWGHRCVSPCLVT